MSDGLMDLPTSTNDAETMLKRAVDATDAAEARMGTTPKEGRAWAAVADAWTRCAALRLMIDDRYTTEEQPVVGDASVAILALLVGKLMVNEVTIPRDQVQRFRSYGAVVVLMQNPDDSLTIRATGQGV